MVDTGILLLHGSSGRPQVARSQLLAREGVTARAIRWFGGPGQPSQPCAIPIESVVREVDELLASCDRVILMGTSFGAELALVTACFDPRVSAVIAFAPTAVVWPGIEDGLQRSHWTWRGRDVPFSRFIDDWEPTTDPPSYLSLYRSSWAASSEGVIPVEQIDGELLLVAGGDDQVWPSVDFAEAIRARRAEGATTVVTHTRAGHRVTLPGERPTSVGRRMARGGDPTADAELGRATWPHIRRLINAPCA